MPSQPGTPALALPRPDRITIVVPTLVVAATAAVLAWSMWPVVRPVREVRVAQAVFVADSAPVADEDTSPSVRTVQAPGWLEAEPFLTAVSALTDGVVESMHALEGDFVEPGDVIARLVAEDAEIGLRRADADVAAAEAAVAAAVAERTAAQEAFDSPVELERAVESWTAQLAEARAELARLPSLVAAAEAAVVRTEEEARRVRRSTEQGATNELEAVIAEQSAAERAAELAALRAREPVLTARIDRLAAELRAAGRDLELRIDDTRRVAVAGAMVAEARAALMRAQAQRDDAALALERTVIRSPIAGYVQRRLKRPGDKVMLGMDGEHSSHLVHVYDPSKLQVRVDVPLADAAQVYVGQPCEVFVEVLPEVAFAGEVLRITHEADLQKNTLQVKVRVVDPDPVLRPEMLTRVRFLASGDRADGEALGEESRTAVRVPSGALETVDGATRVWVVADRREERGVLVPRTVRVMGEVDGWSTVVGEVPAGALIAVDRGGVRAGEPVRIGAFAEGLGGAS